MNEQYRNAQLSGDRPPAILDPSQHHSRLPQRCPRRYSEHRVPAGTPEIAASLANRG